MFRLYRDFQRGEFFVVFADAAQGGSDSNFVQFLSKTQIDIPLVLQMQGVAAEMTPRLREALHYIYDKTGVKPVIAVERQNGGASVMHDLMATNHEGKYKLYHAKDEQQSDKETLGWDTNAKTRPMMLGEWFTAFNTRLVKIYDKETIAQHKTFITNKKNRPEAAPNTHDDAVMSCAGAWQLFQTENPPVTPVRTRQRPKRARYHV